MSGTKILDRIEIDGRGWQSDVHTQYIDIYDNSLSRKWLTALNHLLKNNYHLEKNYCFFGFPNGPRNASRLLEQINLSIKSINSADIGYTIDDYFIRYDSNLNRYIPHREILYQYPDDFDSHQIHS